jgi:hypothetical protein
MGLIRNDKSNDIELWLGNKFVASWNDFGIPDNISMILNSIIHTAYKAGKSDQKLETAQKLRDILFL